MRVVDILEDQKASAATAPSDTVPFSRKRLRKVLALLSISTKHPREFYNLVHMYVDLLLDRFTSKAPTYEAVDWPVALSDMDGFLSSVFPILEEPALKDLQTETSQQLRVIGDAPPWDMRFNSDLTLARCLYLVCRALRPLTVIETGVAYGVSSAFVLAALDVNGSGILHSVDLPIPERNADRYIGMLIPERLKPRWRLYRGTSQERLPSILSASGVDVFIHDSSHTYRNMRREFEMVWPYLPQGGVLIADDVDGNGAFQELQRRHLRLWRVVRQEAKMGACFGIALKG